MALESIGVKIRLADGTVATASGNVLSITTGTTSQIRSSDTAVVDFVTLGFSSAMRIESNSTLNSTKVFTAKDVAASVIDLYDDAVEDTSSSLEFSGRTMAEIGEVKSFSGPSGSPAVIDVTHLGSTAKEKLVGVVDEGQVTFEIFMQSSAGNLHSELRSARSARTKKVFDVTLTDTPTEGGIPSGFYFHGYVLSIPLSGGVDAALTQSVTLEVSSNCYWVDAST